MYRVDEGWVVGPDESGLTPRRAAAAAQKETEV